ncbi:putative spermidine/putrescine transport system substrate-binding protein [Roseomonas rosea]|uniref:Putative spermidine/putrescine transport system substrate-binding protein n=1 Tax=Muricoccus roseus TaxID=198092 RepID=A0A1M6E620_9PROT|nr:extracellular solute-binding protein [Roseomonas rosea]SHI80855.1 putative spermidine/putrescine transport system substrate-binding protein [Roseomonas rosea]
MLQSFHEDCVERAQGALRRGVDRRTALRALGALSLAPLAAGGPARAQGARELVIVNWGGIANEGFGRFYGAPFEAANAGFKVIQNSTGPSAGRIKSMVDSGSVTWDLCDSSSTSARVLGKQNLVEKIDYAVVKKSDAISEAFTLEHGAAPYSFSSVLAYDSSKFPNGAPQSWADFYDLRKFPGTRLMRRDALAVLDAAQMALGKDPRNLYPLDTRACLNKLKEIRRNAVFWANGSESEQFLRTGEAVMGQIWHTRAKVLEQETNGRIKFIWNQGLLQAGIFVIPRGAPGGANTQRLLASMLANPEPQVELLKFLGNGPTNPRAAALVPEEFKRFNPTDPANAVQQVTLDGNWWGDNYTQLNQDVIDIITG